MTPSALPSAQLRDLARKHGDAYEATADDRELRLEQACRAELTRRYQEHWCTLCDYPPDECGCLDCAVGDNVVLVNQYAEGERASA